MNDSRLFFKVFIDDNLGEDLTKDFHTYDDNCEIEVKNLLDNVDHYFIIHLVNWFAAAIIMRDSYLLHVWSIMDEVLELSAQHVLPHFRECWWDHIFHDVLLTNTPGIILGLQFVKWTGLE